MVRRETPRIDIGDVQRVVQAMGRWEWANGLFRGDGAEAMGKYLNVGRHQPITLLPLTTNAHGLVQEESAVVVVIRAILG